MEFIETPTFTRQVEVLLSDEEYRGLQNRLVVYPKSKKDDLSDKETAILRELVKEL